MKKTDVLAERRERIDVALGNCSKPGSPRTITLDELAEIWGVSKPRFVQTRNAYASLGFPEPEGKPTYQYPRSAALRALERWLAAERVQEFAETPAPPVDRAPSDLADRLLDQAMRAIVLYDASTTAHLADKEALAEMRVRWETASSEKGQLEARIEREHALNRDLERKLASATAARQFDAESAPKLIAQLRYVERHRARLDRNLARALGFIDALLDRKTVVAPPGSSESPGPLLERDVEILPETDLDL